jgi:hypothetical protein
MHHDSGSNRECRSAAAVAWLTRVATVTLCLAVHGCDTGKGGAVELSWKLRPASSGFTEKFVDCDSLQNGTGRVAEIELSWSVAGLDDATSVGSKRWPCDDNHGATGFDLPAGPAELSLRPICAPEPGATEQPAVPDTYIAPAAVMRSVIRGETVSLGAVELVVSVSDCVTAAAGDVNSGSQPCICCTAVGACPH